MKKLFLVLALVLAALASAGLVWLVRRPAGGPPEGAAGSPFAIQEVPTGWVIQHQDEQFPLRTFRWLPARGEGILVAQLLTQNDEQQVHLFREGRLQGSWRVERPASVEEGFFRFAELKDACLLQDGGLLLLYLAGGGPSAAESWLVNLDTRDGKQRWQMRLGGSQLTPGTDGKDPAVFVWGPARVVHRVATRYAPGTGPHPAAIELPAEVAAPSGLLAIGSAGFVVAHGKGLSAFVAGRGWTHHPLPVQAPFPAWPGTPARLVQGPGSAWWQPGPGVLYELAADGTPGREIPLYLGSGEDRIMDARMLELLGCDRHGSLWFGLASPALEGPAAGDPVQIPPAPPESAQEAAVDPPAAAAAEPGPPAAGPTAEAIEGWRRHLGRGLGRLYRKPMGGGPIHRYDWTGLWKAWPEASGLPVPQGAAGLRPESGFLVFGAERRIWWLGLPALGAGAAVPAG